MLPLSTELSNREIQSREPRGDAARGNRLLQVASPTAMQSGWFFQIPPPSPSPRDSTPREEVGSGTPGLGRGCEASLKPRRGSRGPRWYQRPLGGGERARPPPALPDAAATCSACHQPHPILPGSAHRRPPTPFPYSPESRLSLTNIPRRVPTGSRGCKGVAAAFHTKNTRGRIPATRIVIFQTESSSQE